MNPERTTIIEQLNVRSTIIVAKEIMERKQFLKSFLQHGIKGFVLGISGGQDSALAGKIAQEAVTEHRAETGQEVKFYALLLPYNTQQDYSEAQSVATNFIDADETITYNIADTVNALQSTLNSSPADGKQLTDYNKGNMKARIRMVTQYAVAAQHNLLVVGADHAAENVTGYFTKHGDGAADIMPLNGLTKRQGKTLLKEWSNTPSFLFTKTPTGDLLDARVALSDETELGLSYDTIDDFLEGKPITFSDEQKIIDLWYKNMHKRTGPYIP